MTLLQFTVHPRAAAGFARPFPRFNRKPVAAAATLIRTWTKRNAERGELARLTDRELRDIGLSRAAVYAETRKPFWRA